MKQKDFISRVCRAMEDYFGADRRRIAHARQVLEYAAELLRYIDADETVTLAAAILHDIGIPEAERKHGTSAGWLQEREGPPVARAILEDLHAPEALIETVCRLVGAHHTLNGVDSPEFRILWDADALVNFAESLPGRSADDIRACLDRHMATEPGRRLAREIFLS